MLSYLGLKGRSKELIWGVRGFGFEEFKFEAERNRKPASLQSWNLSIHSQPVNQVLIPEDLTPNSSIPNRANQKGTLPELSPEEEDTETKDRYSHALPASSQPV